MSIFKANDIRGVWPDEVNASVFERLGRALARLAIKGGVFVVGSDARLSSGELRGALIAGLLREGAEVVDLGVVTTPECHYAKRTLPALNLAMITASHNPAEYNGLKMMLGDQPPTDEVMNALQDSYDEVRGDETSGPGTGNARKLGMREPYAQWLAAQAGRMERIRVVFDAGNGPLGAFGPQILREAGAEVVELNCEVDGRFPGRDPNCAVAANLDETARLVRQSSAALAVAFDGDGDRLAVIDSEGRFVPPDELAVMLVKSGSLDVAGQKVVHDIKCSSIVPEAVSEAGGTPLVEKSGHAYIRRRMLSANARFGVEVSGHYFYRELAGGDDGLVSAVRVIRMAAATPLAELRRRCVRKYHITPDIRVNVPPERQDEILAALEEHHENRPHSRADGLRVEFDGGWALVRKSITEPKLTFRFEATRAESLKEIMAVFCDPLDTILKEAILRETPEEMLK